MKSKYTQFSKMKWLDEEIERNKKSEGRNICSDSYYGILLTIRTAQENGTISDDLYSKVNSWFGRVAPEIGYYTANIHYDLFRNYESTEDIESRMLHFLDKADKTVLKNDSWFEINFKSELRYLMRQRYNIVNEGDDKFFFEKYGNEVEKKLFNEYETLTNRGRPIIYEILIKYYDQSKRKLELLSISFEKFGYSNVPLGRDGRVYSKKSDGRYKTIDIKRTDKYYDSIYALIKHFNKNNNLNRKEYDKFLSVMVKTYYEEEYYSFINEDMSSFIFSLSNIVLNEFNDIYRLDFLVPKKETKNEA